MVVLLGMIKVSFLLYIFFSRNKYGKLNYDNILYDMLCYVKLS